MSNVKMIGVVMLFPGMVTVVEGVIVILGPAEEPVQNTPVRLAFCKVKALPPGAPAS